MIDERIEIIIKKWLKCELIGDEAMTQIDEIFHGNKGNKNESNIEHKDKLISERG